MSAESGPNRQIKSRSETHVNCSSGRGTKECVRWFTTTHHRILHIPYRIGRPEDFFPASLALIYEVVFKQASILSHCHGEYIEFITPWGHRTRISRVLQEPMMIIHKKDKYPAICPETMIKTFLPSSQHVKSIISRNPSTPRPPREAITSTAARITCAKWR